MSVSWQLQDGSQELQETFQQILQTAQLRCCAPVRGCGRPGTAARAYSAVTEQFAAADQTAGRVDKNDKRAEGTQGLDWTHWTST